MPRGLTRRRANRCGRCARCGGWSARLWRPNEGGIPYCPCGRRLLIADVERERERCDLCELDTRIAESGIGPVSIVHSDGSTFVVDADGPPPATAPLCPACRQPNLPGV